jgi:hypothetical protein
MEDYIIKPSIDIRDLFYSDNHLVYIATGKNLNHLRPDTTVYFYSDIEGREGIIAAGIMLDFPTMPKYVPAVYQKHLYAKELKQFPLHFTVVSQKIYIDKKHLFQLPAMNMYGKTDFAKPDYLYAVYGLEDQLDFIDRKIGQLCNIEYDPDITDEHYRLWIHQLREYVFEKNFGSVIPVRNSCSLCRMKYEPQEVVIEHFFELHEMVDIDFNEKYRRLSNGNFKIVCPNCHKKEHEKTLNSFSEKAD